MMTNMQLDKHKDIKGEEKGNYLELDDLCLAHGCFRHTDQVFSQD